MRFILDYETPKRYSIRGIEVVSKIVSDKVNEATGTRQIIVESSCRSERWGTRSKPYSVTTPTKSKEFKEALERIRYEAAETVVKAEESGEQHSPIARRLGIEVIYADSKRFRAAASLTTAIPYTLIHPEIIKILQLPQSGTFHYEKQGNQVVSVPIFNACIRFDDITVDTIVLPSEHNGPIVVGGHFLQAAFNLRKADLIQLLLPDHIQTLSSAARSKKSTVLILGKYGEHRDRLDRIKDALRAKGLNGIILDDYPDIQEQDLSEKMITFASISKFVLVDDVAPSGHIQEIKMCQELLFITAILRCDGRPSTMMQANITEELLYMREFSYHSEADIPDVVNSSVDWANVAVFERSKRLNRLFSDWRSPDRIMR